MTDIEESAYYRRRAEQAEALAHRASEPYIKEIHRVMATDYRALAQECRKISLVRPKVS